MAVRYVEIGQYPDARREVRGNLSEILVAAANPGTYAAPEDVTGCFLEMGAKGGKWYGDLGTMPKATADALYASGALVNLATGATYRDTSGTQYTYSAGAGWVVSGGVRFGRANIKEQNTAANTPAIGSIINSGNSLDARSVLENPSSRARAIALGCTTRLQPPASPIGVLDAEDGGAGAESEVGGGQGVEFVNGPKRPHGRPVPLAINAHLQEASRDILGSRICARVSGGRKDLGELAPDLPTDIRVLTNLNVAYCHDLGSYGL